jgi:hypothetical protein
MCNASDVAVLTCGPAAMVAESSSLCFKYGFQFHTELFHF